MVESLKNLIQLAEENLVRSPWARSRTLDQWLSLVLEEAQEARETPGPEELGDTLWCVLTSILCHGGGPALHAAATLAAEKILRRKPWLREGVPPTTVEEELRIWFKTKGQEPEGVKPKRPRFVFDEILAERARQDAQWGGPGHDDTHTSDEWLGFLQTHLGKARDAHFSVLRFRAEMVKIAALSVAVIEWCDRHLDRKPEFGPTRLE